ncbi:MAG TPA: heparinase II/III family protein [Spirillospora sp.]|nr:heparinase II/III family protein [Spirillospora sp.]
MLSQYNAIDIDLILREENPPPPFPPARDRAAWAAIRERLGEARVAEYIQKAEADAQRPIPALPATLYLDFKRTGERLGYETPQFARRAMLANLALAECLEYTGRFLDPLLDVVWAICEESSWSLPAHQIELTDMERPHIDLVASMTGLELAEFDLLLGAEMDPLVGKRIRYEVDRRLLTPYLTSHQWWWLYNTQRRRVNNWTAVCNANVVGAAIHLEPDVSRLAEIIARAARSLDDYLETFDIDGGSTEGPGYWSYGYGNYVVLAHLVEQRTNGRVNFLAGDQIYRISQFPARTLLSHNLFVNFSDCDRHVTITPSLLAFLARRLDLPQLMALARQQIGPTLRTMQENLIWELRNLLWYVEQEGERFIPAKHDWFGEMHWMIARYQPGDPDALVLAAKGGHNAEMHNQNDVGNFIVQVKGEAVIADIGRGRYTKAYFGPERYQHFVNQSLGHSCPVPNGQQQNPGAQYAAQLLDHQADDSADRLALELKDAYPPSVDLKALRRTITLHRAAPRGWVELVDEAEFASGPGMLESVLTTFGAVDIQPEAVTLTGERGALRVEYEAGVVTPRVEMVEAVDLAEGPADVNRVVFALARPQPAGTIRLRIVPA